MQAIIAHRTLLLWVLGFALLNNLFWVFRLAAFRKDRVARGKFFGDPPLPNWEIYNRDNYVPAARRTFRIVLVSSLVFFFAVIAVGVSIAAADPSAGSAPTSSGQQ